MENEFLKEVKMAPIWSGVSISKDWQGVNIRAVLWNSEAAADFFKKANKFLKLKDIKEAMERLESNKLNIAFWDSFSLVSKELNEKRKKEIEQIPQEIKKLVLNSFYSEKLNKIFFVEDIYFREDFNLIWQEIFFINWIPQEPWRVEKSYKYFLENNFLKADWYLKLFEKRDF